MSNRLAEALRRLKVMTDHPDELGAVVIMLAHGASLRLVDLVIRQLEFDETLEWAGRK